MDKQMMAFGLALIGAFFVIWLLLHLTRDPIVVLEEVKERSAERVLPHYIRSAIKVSLSERQMTREEILNGFHWPPEHTMEVLDHMVMTGEVSSSDGTENPRYTLVHPGGIDVV